MHFCMFCFMCINLDQGGTVISCPGHWIGYICTYAICNICILVKSILEFFKAQEGISLLYFLSIPIIKLIYHKVVSSRLSRLVAHWGIFRLFMKGNFDAYVLWPLNKMVQNWIVDWSTAHNFTVISNKNV